MIGLSPVGSSALQSKRVVGMLGAELGKERTPRKLFRAQSVDHGEMLEGRALSVLGAVSHRSRELIPRPEVEFLDYPSPDVDVVVAWSVCRFPAADETRSSWEDFQDAEGAFLCHASFTVL